MTNEEKQEQLQQAEDKLFNFRPLLFTAIALALGIYFCFLFKIKGVSRWWLCLLIPVIITPFFFCLTKTRIKKTAIATLVLIIVFFVGAFAFSSSINSYAKTPRYNGEYTVVGRVINYKEQGDTVLVYLDELSVGTAKEDGVLTAILPVSEQQKIRLSDEVFIRGYLQTKTNFTASDGFWAYKVSDDIRFELKADKITVIKNGNNPFLLAKERLKEVLNAGMDEIPAAVSFAILTGDTTGMERGLLTNIRYGGIAHIFAVSGLHIGALFGFCMLVISKTKLATSSKWLRFILTATLLLLYGGVCGYSASVVRAIITCLIFYACKLIGFGSDSLERIGTAGIVVLLLNPVYLFEAGFQLSFTACLDIALLSRPFRLAGMRLCKRLHLFPKRKSLNSPPSIMESIVTACVSFLAVTVSAQLVTTPISFYHFGYFSDWSLLLNCLFVPLVGMYFSALLVFSIVACILPLSVSYIVLFVPNVVWSATLLPFEIFNFTASTLGGITFTAPATTCYYAGLTFLTDKWNITKRYKIFLFCLFETAFLVSIVLTLG